MSRMILVSGLPNSGNTLTRAMIQRCAKAAQEKIECWIWHAGPLDGWPPQYKGQVPSHIVVPVRSEPIRLRSMRAWRRRPEDWPPEKCRESLFEFARTHGGVPLKLFPYEGLCSYPALVGGDIADWLRLPWVPFPQRVNGTAEGGLFDANAKHVEVLGCADDRLMVPLEPSEG